MTDHLKFYIDGAWVDPVAPRVLDVINPATEQPIARISLGGADDVDRAVTAARRAFTSFSRTTRQERIELLEAILAEYVRRQDEMAQAITAEMGAPAALARKAQAFMGAAHLSTSIEVLKGYDFADEPRGSTLISREPIGVCAFITPWNWPSNQIGCKVAPALAVGCTMVLKPSEVAPLSGLLWAEIIDAAGIPAGVFNMINGDGPGVGAALSAHPGVDMVSFTGSTRAGVEVAKNAAPTIKRVHQELGGKSANIILDDADIAAAVSSGVARIMNNSGQSCNAPTRMLVPRHRMGEAQAAAKAAAESLTVGDPNGDFALGPVVSDVQWNKIQTLIAKGVEEGATLVTGGVGRPEGLEVGYFVKPTIFADVAPDATIAREEIFGPVLSIIPYDSEDEAIHIANDTVYGLAAYVQSADIDRARNVARQLRAGQVIINGAGPDLMAPFGGYKQSGNGREWGDHAFAEFLEVKATLGYA